MTIISKDITKATRILKSENLVAIPTETVYGLAGNIYSEKAIRGIFEMKQRPLFNPLIVHIHAVEELTKIVRHIPEKAKLLAENFWPGSLTIVLPKKDTVPDLITAGKDTVAVRIPNHPVTLELLKSLDFPLAAPSANPFGCISPSNAEHVESYFKNQLQMVLEGGSCKNGIESTIIGFEDDEPIVYRLGAIAIEDIEHVVGKVIIKNKKEVAPNAPGMLSRHYAPETSTHLVDDVKNYIESFPDKKIGTLLFKSPIKATTNIAYTEILSSKGDLKEATSNLYAALHRLDKQNLDMIVVEKLPNYGLGTSMNDRLLRATKK